MLRGGGLFGKFLLIIFIANYFSLEDVGIYGLVTAAVVFGTYLLGFDFYTYSIREMAASNGADLSWQLKNHLFWLICCYSIFLPLISVVFFLDLLPGKVAFWFYAILIFEHVATELSRLLIVHEKQMIAAISVFARNGLWAFLCVAYMYFYAERRTLEVVFLSWVLGLVFALTLSLTYLNQGGYLKISGAINYRWILSGLKVSFPLLLATLSVKALFTIDRYLLGYVSDTSIVGVYVFYMSVAAVVIAIIEQGVFNFFYPRLIRCWRLGNIEAYKKQSRAMERLFLICVVPLLVATVAMVDFSIGFIGRPEYLNNIYVLYGALVASFFFTWSMVYYYELYSRSLDRYIVIIRFSGFLVFVALFGMLGGLPPLHRTLYSICAASAWLLLTGFIASRMRREHGF